MATPVVEILSNKHGETVMALKRGASPDSRDCHFRLPASYSHHTGHSDRGSDGDDPVTYSDSIEAPLRSIVRETQA
jgi:hypothetical protein